HCLPIFFSSPLRPPPLSTLFPYTTLFRSLVPPLSVPVRHLQAAELRLAEPVQAVERLFVLIHHIQIAAGEVLILFDARDSLQIRSEEHTSELQSRFDLVCRLLLEKKKQVL